MSDFYSRVASASLIKEVTPNTPLTPTTFFPLMEEDMSTEYAYSPSIPVQSNRALNLRAVKNRIPAPEGSVTVHVEPKTWGHFMNGIFGGVTSGNFMQFGRRLMAGAVTGTPQVGATLLQATSLATGTVYSLVSGNAYFDLQPGSGTGAFDITHVVTGTNPDSTTFTFTPSVALNWTAFVVGDTVTGATSSKTATVAAVDEYQGVLLVTSPSGAFTANEKITGTGGGIATMIAMDTTVYGHMATVPASTLPTYTMQFNLADMAIRYIGCRFRALDTLGQKDNIITAHIKVMAQGQFRQAKVTAVTTSGAGTKTISVDQTYGLVASDSIKLYRPGSGFQDFSASTVKTHTIASVASTTSITVTNLQTSTAVGDLILLAPQTASYTIGNEFPWVGGSYGQLGASLANMATEAMEDFTFIAAHETEARHSAQGNLFKDQFPTAILQKGVKGNGTFKCYYQDEDFYRNLRTHTAQAFRIKTLGDLITGSLYNQLWVTFPEVQLDPYQTNVTTDDMVNEEVPFSAFYNTTNGYLARSILVNTVSSY